MACHLSLCSVERQLEQFWAIEEVEDKRHYSKEESECENHFQQTHSRDETGRFVVKLPVKLNHQALGNSRNMALTRFRSLERKFAVNQQLHDDYCKFIEEYLQLGHMSKSESDTTNQSSNCYFLPHHAVFKESSSTTKVRVVFDGSAKTSTNTSLNDILMVGAKTQSDLWDILLRFRQHTFVICADIEKMYRQILIHPDDRHLQKIMWRKYPTSDIEEYELNTVTYGLASSPFLATRCLIQLATAYEHQFKEASERIKKDMYVDDLLTGGESLDAVAQLKNDIVTIMRAGQFTLRKWKSNNESLVNDSQHDSTQLVIASSKEGRTLGLDWRSADDTISYSTVIEESGCTKRLILSQITKLFDPLGLLAPIIICAKMIMQSIWSAKTEWDQPIPEDIKSKWATMQQEFPLLEDFHIPRHAFQPNATSFEIHLFSDASEKGYGAAMYIRSNDDDKILVCLLCAKSRVAPLKSLSLPRLELCAALLGARLLRMVTKALTRNPEQIVCWTDSTIVLHWIQKEPSSLKTFVANRVAEIQQLTAVDSWRHVPTQEKPADLVSRGTSVSTLLSSDLWWNGPEFLTHDEEFWPPRLRNIISDIEADLELKKAVCNVVTQPEHKCMMFEKFSSWTRMVRVTAYCLRFTKTSRKFKVPDNTVLTSHELKESELRILQLLHQDIFCEEIATLNSGKHVKPKSPLKLLNPYVDSNNNLVRVGGRLRKSMTISTDTKHPIVLPFLHFITMRILRYIHCHLNHCGVEQLLATTRLHYWPIKGRIMAKQVLKNCLVCVRFCPRVPKYVMADLPRHRIEQARPFKDTGVDYAGPIFVRESRRRGRVQKVKAYIAVFVCMKTKAIHLELVSSLTTDAFLCALIRFVSRRGLCENLFSDNGTNFIGAFNELKEVYVFLKANKTEIQERLANLKINWHFIPPRAPHFGGIWESAVKAFKRHFYRVTWKMTLTFEECVTLITQIEAILNSRPLNPSSDDPNDLSYLCPSHFLIGDYLLELPSKSYINLPDNRLSYYQYLQKTKQHFWQRWHKEYLQSLQQRSSWHRGEHGIQCGTMVLIMEDNIQPLQWPLARVISTHPGEDGIVRVVTLRTSAGVIKRPIRKLCELPVRE